MAVKDTYEQSASATYGFNSVGEWKQRAQDQNRVFAEVHTAPRDGSLHANGFPDVVQGKPTPELVSGWIFASDVARACSCLLENQ